ncbi:MAG: D-alanyl-D-alanine carboxypeptidase family protein [Acutalibacteraceae bacterium]|nr:D-alanyl-D-alanine carboxypeptidase [Oscillospiraceae bacterium]
MKKVICFILSFAVILPCLVFCGYAENAGETGQLAIKAKSAVLMDASTGQVLYKYNENEKLPPASVTKIMSLLLIAEAIDNGKIKLTDEVTASAEAAAKGGSQIWLKEGETMSVDELLKAVAIASANDACCALGEYIAGSESAFVNMMNERAKELGMNNTHFENCSGLDDDTTNHLTTAYDIGLMSVELLKHEFIENYTTVWMDSLRDGATELVNTNRLVRFYNGTTGIKTGTTSKAGKCLSASAKRDGLHLVAVVMGSQTSDDRFETAKTLLNYGFANYESVNLTADESLITDVKVIRGAEDTVKPGHEEFKSVTLKKGDKDKISAEINLSTDAEAPIENGQTLGSINFVLNGEIISKCRLFSPQQIKRTTYADVIKAMLRSLTHKK